jgi:WD40 repeat protein
VTETNALALSGAHMLFSGDGDGRAHAWDVRARQPHTAVYRGHSGPIYCIDTCSPSLPSASAPASNAASSNGDYLLATGGEDGRLCLFDVRNATAPLVVLHPTRDASAPAHTTQSSLSATKPSSSSSTSAPAASVPVPGAGAVPYISCVKLSWPWLLVGGAHEFVSIYHAPSLEIAAALPQMGVPQALAMVDEKVCVHVPHLVSILKLIRGVFCLIKGNRTSMFSCHFILIA